MDDETIIGLYFDRSETAIGETREKYGGYCSAIAYRILESFEDAEECLSDVYLKTWETIPPTRPRSLKAYLGRLTRNLALDRRRRSTAQKRGGLTEVLEEWDIPALEEPPEALERQALSRAISEFLKTLPPPRRNVFLLRYWYCESVKEISLQTGMPAHTVNTYLYRTRKQLKTYLEQEGFDL